MPGCAQAITSRGLDQFYNTEEDCLVKKADLNAIVKLLQVLTSSGRRNAVFAVHLVCMQRLLSCSSFYLSWADV